MTLQELQQIVASVPPGSLVPVDWVAAQLESVDGVGPDPLRDLSLDEVCTVLGRSGSTVREYCRSGRLPGSYRQRGREWRIPHGAIRAFQRAEAEARAPSRSVNSRGADSADLGSWRDIVDAGREP